MPDIKKGRSILIVEDEMIASLFLSHCVERMGHEVVWAASTGEEAVEKAASLDPDLVIMDLGLKGEMDGVEAASIIDRQKRIPILFVSAYTLEEICRHEDLPEVFDYLPKPLDDEKLAIKIRSIFGEDG